MSQKADLNLANVIHWGHRLLSEVVTEGDLLVDLTAGNGHDTLALSRMGGLSGQVVACDIQRQALDATASRLADAGLSCRRHQGGGALPAQAGIDLVQIDHAAIAALLPGAPAAIIANLGYLPGGDQSLITRPETTLRALSSCCEVLTRGGRMAIVVYPGHAGGAEEAAEVSCFFSELDPQCYQVVQIRVCNRSQAPFLIMTEKR